MVRLAAHRCTVFAVQGYVKDASSARLLQFSRQLLAVHHPRFHATVVVAHGQQARSALGTK
jgi:hypothetical protein